jgi:hypothetical protein
MKSISLTGKQIRKLRDQALREQRRRSAQPTKVVNSKKVYSRRTLNSELKHPFSNEGWDA